MSKKLLEVRTMKAEVRAKKAEDGTPHLEGYAAVFNQETDLGWFHEKIAPGAFKRALSEGADVRCLFNHDPNYILGRTASKTLTVSEDSKGLAYDCALPSGPMAQHVREAVERGDVDGSSFGFVSLEETWEDEKDDKGRIVKSTRTVTDADLYDVSPVVYPAYDGTSVASSVRSLWPNGMPEEVRSRRAAQQAECQCDCQQCVDGDCEKCTNADCEDENCRCNRTAPLTPEQREKKTKRVDGEDLTASCFLIVGDPEDPGTWKLPWKFSSEEKTKAHLRNAVARFNQLKGATEADKAKAWKKLVALCKAHEIDVAEDNAFVPSDEKRRREEEVLLQAQTDARVRAVEASLD